MSTGLTWPSANRAFYIPFALPFPYPVKRVFWVNGTSITSTNRDFGIYTLEGTRIYSTGSTAAAGSSSAAQYVTPSPDFLLMPGSYFFGISCSSVTAARGGEGVSAGTGGVAALRLLGVLQEDSALPLPATMTPAVVANINLPLCGITKTTTGF